jgi:hypothetical protein
MKSCYEGRDRSDFHCSLTWDSLVCQSHAPEAGMLGGYRPVVWRATAVVVSLIVWGDLAAEVAKLALKLPQVFGRSESRRHCSLLAIAVGLMWTSAVAEERVSSQYVHLASQARTREPDCPLALVIVRHQVYRGLLGG